MRARCQQAKCSGSYSCRVAKENETREKKLSDNYAETILSLLSRAVIKIFVSLFYTLVRRTVTDCCDLAAGSSFGVNRLFDASAVS